MKKLESYEEKRRKLFGATEGQEQDLRNETLNDICDKINEIIEFLNDLK